MNLIPKICELLGVEIGEEFRIKWPTCKKPNEEFYKFTKDGFCYYDQAMCEWVDSLACVDLISDKAEVIKRPFEPKDGERYWYVYWNFTLEYPCVTDIVFKDSDMCYYHIYCGNCFRTKAEAEKHKYEIYEKLTGRKWEEKCDT